MNKTKIEWTDCTLNPIVGCSHNCTYCYARIQAKRQKQRCQYCYKFVPHLHFERLSQLSRKQKPRRIFIDSMWDWNDAKVPLPWILPILLTMEDCPQHTFQILSKRPKRYGRFNYPENVWLGTSLTSWRDQYVINDLLDLHNENLKFLSIEPLQGPLKFWLSKVDWVIVGAETGHRPGKIMPEREWVEKIIENCRAEAIPVFLKNNLGWPEKIQEYPREARP